MGLLSRFFLKRAERSFETCLRVIQIDLAEDLCNIYSSQMDHKAARTLAAQIVNFLKGEDIDEIARVSDEPLRSRIMAILPQVRQRAAECMQADRQTRGIIVATLRMTSFLNYGKYGRAWFQSPAKMRIEQLLVEYGPEFPEGITLAAYEQLSARYHAVNTVKQQAASGKLPAQLSLGGLYFDGLGVPQDYAQAASWYRKAAEQGNDGAQYKLGVLYCYGLGVPQDYTQAAAWWRKATEQADAVAQDGQGAAAFMLMALGAPFDYAEAYFWLDLAVAGKLVDAEQVAKYRDEAASHLTPADLARVQERARSIRDLLDADRAEAWFKEGRELWRGHRLDEAAACFTLAAERGHITAQYNLSGMYHGGHGVPQDYAQAAFWCRKAAEQGFAPAQNNLGALYHHGHGVPQDDTQAVSWCRKAVEQGFTGAQHNFEALYHFGHGMPQDDVEVYFYLDLAIADEHDATWRNRVRSIETKPRHT